MGVFGLGRGFMLSLPSLLAHPDIELSAAASSREAARRDFAEQYGGTSYATYEELLADTDCEIIYIATPHERHADDAVTALRAGKHVLLEKPITITMEDADRIIEAEKDSGKAVIIGPSHSFDPAIQQASQLISSGLYGPVRIIHSAYHTDFMYRPRRPKELDPATGGVIFSQGAHQFDIARLLAGGDATQILGQVFINDPARKASGAYACQISFSGGGVASLIYSGYDHYLSDLEMGSISELGKRAKITPGAARKRIRGLSYDQEALLKQDRGFGSGHPLPSSDSNEHFGRWVVSLVDADLIIGVETIDIYDDNGHRRIDVVVTNGSREPICDAVVSLARHDSRPIQCATWGRATLECCHALIASSAKGAPVKLQKQVSVFPHPNNEQDRKLT